MKGDTGGKGGGDGGGMTPQEQQEGGDGAQPSEWSPLAAEDFEVLDSLFQGE